MSIRFATALLFIGIFFGGCGMREPSYPAALESSLPEKVSFNYDVRPILTDKCFSCHGPDAAARKGELRLDEESALNIIAENGRKAIHPKAPKKSEVWHRIYSNDPEIVMPPPESNLALTDYEKALVSKWIAQGGAYKPHWAFTPIDKPIIPTVKATQTIQNPIDNFVLSKLEKAENHFSPPADKERLLRRLSFDLTGLPPSLAEIDAFLADDSSSAYEKVVDRLLSSKAYAERMTMDWLDLARYADSQGLHSDGWRSMYPWRDWVLKAFFENMRYDQFLTWQLAGDLLPNPSREQLIATGFNRNHKTTAEGGAVDEEYRMEYVHDRVATTATTFMGLTMECARCHDHKYDPVSQEAYYQFFAYFNQVDELGLTGDDGNAGPNLLLPSAATEKLIKEIQQEIKEQEKALDLSESELAKQKGFITQLQYRIPPLQKQAAIYLPFDKIGKKRVDNHPATSFGGEIEIVTTTNNRKALEFNDGYEYLGIQKQGLFDHNEPFSAAIWINPKGQTTSQTIMGNSSAKGMFWRGWDFALDSLNRLSFRMINALPHDALLIHTIESIPVNKWTAVAFSYDGSGKAGGVQLFINGKAQKTITPFDRLARSIYPIAFNKEKKAMSLRLGKSYRGFTGEYGIYEGLMDEFLLFDRQLSVLEIAELAGISTIKMDIADYQKNTTSQIQESLLQTWKLNHRHPIEKKIATLRAKKIALLDTVPEVMIMQEVENPRRTYIMDRGNYDQPTTEVFPNTPKSVLQTSETFEKNRLGLTKWLLNKDNPLTSRVAVNRFWQQFFGKGLVDTPHDFGLQGSLPTHPELLDWLAYQFMENDWDIKALIKLIVLSNTYRQSSQINPEMQEKDPNNLLLARGPSYRLPAEMIRDNALAASGLLNPKIGGPSVKPIQPNDLWREKTSSTHILRHYEPDIGESRYRRSLYTFVRRTSPHPSMIAFDAPTRSVCTAQRQQTNTPMQALILLNDPQFVEASIHLATEVLQKETLLENQLTKAFRLLTGKFPSTKQTKGLKQLFEEEITRFQANPTDSKAFLNTGQYAPDSNLPVDKLAAMTLVVNTVMNFDEAYMKR